MKGMQVVPIYSVAKLISLINLTFLKRNNYRLIFPEIFVAL
jgi:hypothetical protein